VESGAVGGDGRFLHDRDSLLGYNRPVILRRLLLVLFGGTLCTLLDQVHVHTGTLSYARPAVFGQAVWVLPMFMTAVAAMLVGWPAIASALGEPVAPREGPEAARELGTGLLWFVGVYASSGVFNALPWVLTGVYAVTFLYRLRGRGTRAFLVNTGLLALGGVVAEASLSSTGAFRYDCPGTYMVPVWLPGLYLHGAFLLQALLRRFPVTEGAR
jgi:hypothetical protein